MMVLAGVFMNKKILLSLFFSLCLGQAFGQNQELSATLDTMAEGYYLPTIRAAFGSFTFEQSGLPTPFARWIEDRILLATPKTKRLSIINRSAAAAMDPTFRKNYEEFFKETGTDALLHGRYFIEGALVRVRLELTDLKTATLISVADWLVKADTIPASASVRPMENALARAKELSQLGSATQGGLQISLSTERGSNAAYQEGEDLVILLGISSAAYVRLYHVDSAGHIQLIWPNRFGGGNGYLRPDTIIRLPGADDPFLFRLKPPYGTEFLKAIASSQPFSDSLEDFKDLGTNATRTMTRGLSVQSSSAPAMGYAEALASYYIGPK
jgi:hypothetical protein